MVAGFSDISSEKQRELERMAYVDSVTGGNNYESFKKKIRDFRQPGYLVSMDIHSFKIINSICGIIKGDETLKGIWKCIQEILEKGDLAGHINADRFVIYSSGKDQEKTIRQLQQLGTILAELSVRLKVPKLIPYFGVTKWKPDAKVEEVYSEANFAKNQIKDRSAISFTAMKIRSACLKIKPWRMNLNILWKITVLRCGISRNMIRKQSGW